jgi:hypothetical protein
MSKRLVFLLVGLLLVCVSAAFAGDIVTVPTANQVKAGEVDLAAYYLFIDSDELVAPLPAFEIDFVRAQTLYVGVTDQLELDVHRYDVDFAGENTIVNATWKLLDESAAKPIIVLGGRDLTSVYDHASYFVSAAKTLNPPVGGPPTGPIYRLHVSLGTEDNTLLGEGRHEGLFGGLQVLVKPQFPQVGLVALWDSTDLITGITVVPKPNWPTIKGGTFGEHSWVGISYTFNMK